DFKLPSYSIRGAYGIDLVNHKNGSYSFSGQGGWRDLDKGETAKAIFIIDDHGQKAKIPEFKLQGSTNSILPEVKDTKSIVSPTEPPEVKDTKSIVTPTKLSSNAVKIGFENHGNNTVYGSNAQNKDWDVRFSSNDMDRYARISNKEAYSGNNSLKITYPDNTQMNAGAGWNIPDAKEYYLSYQVKFANNFDFNGKYGWSSGGKLPGLGADELWSGGSNSDGTKGFTSRPMWREDGQAILYLYHMDKPGKYGEDISFTGADGKDKFFERGKWHNITQRVRINDGHKSNGEVDVWMDGEQVLSEDNLQFVTDGQEIDTLFFNTFHGGNGSEWWPDNDVDAYFDEFVVSTNAADVGL
ncbi:MAG: polysaccharide lyase, partial [Cyanobacteria bacterium P01_G01_bin.19]